ncbi:unnamed protein product, partial [Gongylonema pulchrum]|uniref:CSRNP_N domain-containing protein n=1 Tax=Gongylonema pulchrum TaxID=637853 RepID=A0A183EAA1_9BILA
VDAESFPCNCTASTCANPFGRREFDARHVRSHLHSTLMRLRDAQIRNYTVNDAWRELMELYASIRPYKIRHKRRFIVDSSAGFVDADIQELAIATQFQCAIELCAPMPSNCPPGPRGPKGERGEPGG